MNYIIDKRQFYQVGGTISADSPSYVQRKADDELLGHIAKGNFCYVLTPRQMGKSSLMVRTANKLKEKHVQSVIIDLQHIVQSGMSPKHFYGGLVNTLIQNLKLQVDLSKWWDEHETLSEVNRFNYFIKSNVLHHVPNLLVIFIDEIDNTLKLDFGDSLFATIRALYNERASNSELNRISLVLLGVASPSDLIKEKQRSPFNIGQRIELTDFNNDEAIKLADGLHQDLEKSKQLLNSVLHWTNGHPYLTQKVCSSLMTEAQYNTNNKCVDNCITSLFFSDERWRYDDNLSNIINRIIEDKENSDALLQLYRRIISGEAVQDDVSSSVYRALKLSGIVKVFPGGWLRPRNKIYENVFDLKWVTTAQPSELVRQITVILEKLKNLTPISENRGLAENLYQELCSFQGYEKHAKELLYNFNKRLKEATEILVKLENLSPTTENLDKAKRLYQYLSSFAGYEKLAEKLFDDFTLRLNAIKVQKELEDLPRTKENIKKAKKLYRHLRSLNGYEKLAETLFDNFKMQLKELTNAVKELKKLSPNENIEKAKRLYRFLRSFSGYEKLAERLFDEFLKRQDVNINWYDDNYDDYDDYGGVLHGGRQPKTGVSNRINNTSSSDYISIFSKLLRK